MTKLQLIKDDDFVPMMWSWLAWTNNNFYWFFLLCNSRLGYGFEAEF